MVASQPLAQSRLFLRRGVYLVAGADGQRPSFTGTPPDLDANVRAVTPVSLNDLRLRIPGRAAPRSIFGGFRDELRLPFTVVGLEGPRMVRFKRSTCTFVLTNFWKHLDLAGGIDERITIVGELSDHEPQGRSPEGEVLTNCVVTMTEEYAHEERSSTERGDWTEFVRINLAQDILRIDGVDYLADYKASATGQAVRGLA